MKVVLDTNVLVSGILWKGNEARVVLMCQIRDIENHVSAETLTEFARVISSPKFDLSADEVEEAVNLVTAFSTMVVPRRRFQAIEKDPSDDRFLECAHQAGAKYIISGDEHLLGLGKFKGIKIVKAREFLK